MTKEDIQEIVRRLEAVGFSVAVKENTYFTSIDLYISGELTAELCCDDVGAVWVHVAGDERGYGIRPTSVDDAIAELRDTLLRDAAACEWRANRLRSHAGRLA